MFESPKRHHVWSKMGTLPSRRGKPFASPRSSTDFGPVVVTRSLDTSTLELAFVGRRRIRPPTFAGIYRIIERTLFVEHCGEGLTHALGSPLAEIFGDGHHLHTTLRERIYGVDEKPHVASEPRLSVRVGIDILLRLLWNR